MPLFFVFFSCVSSAESLKNFPQIKENVILGKTINIVVDFFQCTNNNQITQPVLLGVFTPKAIIVAPHYVTTSLLNFTLNNPRFRDKAIYEFIKYKISDDNIVKITTQFLDATNYQPLIEDKFELECQLNTAAKIYTNS